MLGTTYTISITLPVAATAVDSLPEELAKNDYSGAFVMPTTASLVAVSVGSDKGIKSKVSCGPVQDSDGFLREMEFGYPGSPAIYEFGEFNGAMYPGNQPARLEKGKSLLWSIQQAAGTPSALITMLFTFLEG